jgi:hypothetical protein
MLELQHVWLVWHYQSESRMEFGGHFSMTLQVGDIMTADKTHKGSIKDWVKLPIRDCPGLGYIICGTFVDHEDFGGRYGHTSYVVEHDETTGEIETRNSRYTLVGKEYVQSEPVNEEKLPASMRAKMN